MSKTLAEIAKFLKADFVGDPNTVITGISGIKEAKEGDITFVANPKYSHLAKETKASAIIASKDFEESTDKPVIRADNPSLAFSQVVSLIFPVDIKHPQGIHPQAILSKTVKLGKNVSVGACAVLEDNVDVGNNTIIYGGCYLASGVSVGNDCLIYPNVSIRERVKIGNRVIINNGTVIGSDGFGYVTIEGRHQRIPQVGTVVVEDDVEIGANVAIDRARFDKTIIGKGTKIDNLVHIAHNVVIGENSLIIAQTGISGSSTIGKNVILAGQSGVVGHIDIGDNVVVGAQSGVTKSVPANTTVSGYPAKPHDIAKRVNACIQRLPQLFKTISSLQKKIEELEQRLKDK
ncbi:MAG: UDP-3-O-(3-hydroxymyristoyl)glucosamine N-acyltransferase [Candidatus Omnitrophica bacterium]|nr:UDP-3-O-(3-hydroxymyristoyl)glucosamine N-acyltransferase [Candidatus Omnitrophota bacterium]HOX53915.1 UDP-3-O-(3-hydroxymyristoyl)glucosamine N-acyltransferase [Candidatus Omnitrophota bacterium]